MQLHQQATIAVRCPQERLDELLAEDAELSCPITLQLFHTPVVASDGGVYEEAAIITLASTGGLSPISLQPLGAAVPLPAWELQQKCQTNKQCKQCKQCTQCTCVNML